MRVRLLTVAAIPAAGLLLAYTVGPEHPARLFRADLSALVLAVSVGAFATRADRSDAVLILLAGVLSAGAHLVVGGGLAGGGTLVALVIGCATAAFGLTRLAQGVGAPEAFARVLAWVVLAIAMSGLFWADRLAEHVPAADRYAVRQAALQLDPATACAYGVARYDRLHDAEVYSSVELASATHVPPTGLPTALAWLAVGLVSAALGGGWKRRPSEEVAT